MLAGMSFNRTIRSLERHRTEFYSLGDDRLAHRLVPLRIRGIQATLALELLFEPFFQVIAHFLEAMCQLWYLAIRKADLLVEMDPG